MKEDMTKINVSKKRRGVERVFEDPYIARVHEDTQLLIRNVIVNMLLCFFIGTTLVLWFSNSNLKETNRELTQINEEYASRLAQVTSELNEASRNVKLAKIRIEQLDSEISKLKELVDKMTREPYNLFDLRVLSNATATKIDNKLFGTPLFGQGEAFIKAEKEHKINAWYLVAHAVWESGWGKSKQARTKFNLFGYGVENEDGTKAYSYKSFSDCIDKVSEQISEDYLVESGAFYGGGFGLKNINKMYAVDLYGNPNMEWSKGISKLMAQLSK